MTHDEKLKRLKKLGWTVTQANFLGWQWNGPNSQQTYGVGPWSSPPPIPDELAALLEPSSPPEQAWTPEPWTVEDEGEYPGIESSINFSVVVWAEDDEEGGILGRTHEEALANATRIVQCVNDCAPYPNPASHIAEQNAKIERLENALENARFDIEILADDDSKSMSDGVKVTMAKTALAAIESAKS